MLLARKHKVGTTLTSGGLKHNDQVHLEEEKGKGSLHRTTCAQVWYEDFRW